MRELLYPLGYLASLAFGARFFLQWINSELQQQSVVTRSFWRLSLIGNLMLMIHSFIQLQYHVCIIQAGNAVISWRNLNLMEKKEVRLSFLMVQRLLLATLTLVTLGFIVQGYLLNDGQITWFRLPLAEEKTNSLHFLWHVMGSLGLFLFSSRFWIQWLDAEKTEKSNLSPTFWWLSLTGGALSLLYFFRIDDPVNVIGPAFGLIPYVRNLMLIQKSKEIKRVA